MKKKFKLMFTFMVMLCLAICLGVNASAAEIADSGNCGANGDNVTWVLYDDGNLVISGEGEMADYLWYNSPFPEPTSIKTVVIEDGVTNIGDYLFYSFETITEIAIPASVTSIGEYAFDQCKGLKMIAVDENNESYSSEQGILFNKDKTMLVKYPATKEGSSYTVPDSVASFADSAFMYSVNLEEVVLGSNVTKLSKNLFDWCENLKKVEFLGELTEISDFAFARCSSLSDITIPDSVTTIGKDAFWSCESLKSIYIPANVSYIGESAFGICDILESITVDAQNSYYSDENGVLYNKDKTELIQFPRGKKDSIFVLNENTTVIKSYAVYWPEYVRQIVLPRSITKIENSAVDLLSGYLRIYYAGTEEEWNNIEKNTGGHDFDNVKIYYNTTCVHESSDDRYCDACGEIVELADGICGEDDGDNVVWTLYINGDFVISGNGAMCYPSDIPYIDDLVFTMKIIIEQGVTVICEGLFVEWPIESVTIPASVTEIGYASFANCLGLKKIIVDENNEHYTSDNGVLFNKDKSVLITYPAGREELSYAVPESVTSIFDGAFAGSVNLTEIVIPDSVTTIGEYAFLVCENLKSVTIGSGLTELGDYVFEESYNLTDIYYNGTKADWDKISLGDNEELENISIHYVCDHADADKDGLCDDCNEIFVVDSAACGANVNYTLYSDGKLVISGEGDMYDYNSANSPLHDNGAIKNVVIEYGVTSIGDNAFTDCEKMADITIADSVTSIGKTAFFLCQGLTNITIPGSVMFIEEEAFYACTGLESVTIENGVTSIGDMAFMECGSLKYVTIPESVSNIGLCPFAWTMSLESITVDENNEYYLSDNGILFNKDKTELIAYTCGSEVTSYTIPESVTTIADGAFIGSPNLEEVVIPDSVTSIGISAFGSCEKLASVTIGSGVTYMGMDTFCDSNNLTDVYYNGTEADWNNISAEDPCLDYATIHYLVVPHVHTPEVITIPATCKAPGMEYTICTDPECGETIGESTVLAQLPHTPGEWVVVTEATYEAEGKKEQRCAECGELLAEEVMPKLVRVTVADDKTGVAIEFDSDEYDGEVEVAVEETFDGKAFNLISTNVDSTKATVFDISMSVDGVTVQPNGKLTVKIPLPEGYNPNQCFIYYLNTDNNTVEKLATSYADGYLTFETDHFSYYAVVEVAETADDSDECSCNCHKTGFMGFIWKILCFFYKLFKMNPVCACGAAHY